MRSQSHESRAGSLQHTTKDATASTRDSTVGASPRGCLDPDVIEPEPPYIADEEENDSSDWSCNMSHWTPTKPKKSVRWSTITVHEFGVGLGGSAVSNKGGPSIGLADIPEFTWTTKVGEMAECVEGVHRFSPSQRIRLLQTAGIPDGIIMRHAREANIILGSRRRSKISCDDSELDESEEEKDEPSMEILRKRSADQAMLKRPCSVYFRRPRMIPVNYA